jgi:enoyl-CoA hydratase
MLTYDTLRISSSGGVATIELNRPDKGNSIDGVMWTELKRAFDEMDTMTSVRAVVLRGAGKHFSTGIDLGFLAELQQDLGKLPEGIKQERLKQYIVELQEAVNAVENCRKPVLAAVQGYCMGAGVDIAAACDMRYATGATRFSVKEVDLAIVADLGSLQRLPKIVGEGIARELAFTGRIFKGQEAVAMGFVNRLYQNRDELMDGISTLAHEISKKSPLTIRGIKETMNFSRDRTVADGLDYVAVRNAAMLLSRDLEEAVTAFIEKRPPRYEPF